MPAAPDATVTSADVEPEEGLEDEGPLFAWISPDDRLWRHPSETVRTPAGSQAVHRAPFGLATLRTQAGRTWGVAVAAGVVGALLASSVGLMTGTFTHRTTVVQPVRVMSPDTVAFADAAAPATGWSSITDEVAPSLVAISVTGPRGMQTGSGVVYIDSTTRTYILTDQEIVDGPGPIRVSFDDGTIESGHLLRSDAETGLALLWVSGGGRAVPTFGSIGDVREADTVMAIGGGAIVPGTVSSVDRAVNLKDGTSRQSLVALTSASMPPGVAGGAVVDQQGAIVAIATRAASSDPAQQQFAFAVPIDVAEHIASDIENGRPPTHPWLGVDVVNDLSSTAARNLGLTGGVQVQTLAERGPAALAGIGQSDIITSFGGTPVPSVGSLTQLLSRCEPGQSHSVSYLHKGKPVTVTITVAEQRSPDSS